MGTLVGEVETTCAKCPENCAKCTISQKCDKCIEKPDYYEKWGDGCSRCIANCLRCSEDITKCNTG